jgi:hypothetical protein
MLGREWIYVPIISPSTIVWFRRPEILEILEILLRMANAWLAPAVGTYLSSAQGCGFCCALSSEGSRSAYRTVYPLLPGPMGGDLI